MREEAAIKNCVSKCCHSATNDLYSSNEIQKWLYRRRGYQRASVDSDVNNRPRRVHRGFVLERRENPISGLRAYWRPLKGAETSAAGRTKKNSSRKVSVFWRKSASVPSTDSSSRCAVWQCYQRPASKATASGKGAKRCEEKERNQVKAATEELNTATSGKDVKRCEEKEYSRRKEQTKNQSNVSQKTVKESSIQCQIRRIEKPRATRTLHNSATQTPEENVSNTNRDIENVDELPDKLTSEDKAIDNLDIREYMKDTEQKEEVSPEEKMIAEKLRQMRAEEIQEMEREQSRKAKQHVDRGTRFARALTITKKENYTAPGKCPTCGNKVPDRISSSEEESSASDDDPRLDQVVQNSRWALDRRAAVHKLFLLDNDDLERR